MSKAYIYILANKAFGTLYIGMTIDLARRIWEHKHRLREGFTKRYGVDRLVYYECFDYIEEAENRERVLKEWKRRWKIELIMKANPEWNDLYNNFVETPEMDPGFRRD